MRPACLLLLPVLLLALGALHSGSAQGTRRRLSLVCYHTNWSQYRTGDAKFVPEDIDPHLCTHIIYAFAFLRNNQLTLVEWNDVLDYTAGMYNRTVSLRQRNPELKVLLAVGGWTMGTQDFVFSASSPANRQAFASNALAFLRLHGFDGLDLDWEYPGHLERGGSPSDKPNFTAMIRALRDLFDREAASTGRPRLLLTAAVTANQRDVDNGYEVDRIARDLDLINLMSYDLHGPWETVTGHNSPLFSYRGDSDPTLNVAAAARHWVERGAPRDKVVIGMPTYGHGWQLADPDVNTLGAPTRGKLPATTYIREPGKIAYFEMCQLLKDPATEVKRPADIQAPYALYGDLWIGFDDEWSIANKVRWLLSEGFGGAMVWSLAQDDFKGTFCGGRRFPIISVISDCLLRGQGQGYCEALGGQPNPTLPSNPTPVTTRPTTTRPTFTTRPPFTSWPTFTSRPTQSPFTPPPITQSPFTPPPITQSPFTPRPPTNTQRPTMVGWWWWLLNNGWTTAPPPPPTTTRPTPQVSTGQFRCVPGANGYYSDPANCAAIHLCRNGQLVQTQFCAPGTYFNSAHMQCEWRNGIC